MSASAEDSKTSSEPIWQAIGKLAMVLGSLYIAHEILVYRAVRARRQKQAICDKDGVAIKLTDTQWAEFWQNGFVKIGKTLNDTELRELQQRTDDIMSGNVNHGDKLLMQVDESKNTRLSTTSDYETNDLSNKGQTTGFKGGDTKYRKIGEAGCGLECDDKFLAFMRKAVFKDICARIYGAHCPIGMYRAMIFNKPAKSDGGGSFLPYHQDGGNWWSLDRDPLVFTWTALHDATRANGCVQAIRGSYKLGILSRRGHTLSAQHVEKYCSNEKDIVYLEAKAGETYLVHNWTIHRSGTNMTEVARLGFSANYIDGRTKMLNPKPREAWPLADVNTKFAEIFASPFVDAEEVDVARGQQRKINRLDSQMLV